MNMPLFNIDDTLPLSKKIVLFIKKIIKRLKGFTLVELLIVVGILVTLTAAVVLYINPLELVKQSNDSKRLADIGAIDKSLSLYRADDHTEVLGDPHVVYLSLPDLDGNPNNDCKIDYPDLPTLEAGYTYHCVTSENLGNIDGTGWVPVNLTSLSSGAPLSHLPVDPINDVTRFDAFIAGSDGSWVLTTKLESVKYLTEAETDGGSDEVRLEVGNHDLSVAAGFVGTPAGGADVAIDTAAIGGVTVPVRAATPVTAVTETSEYTGTVSWSPTDNPFAASTIYTATITLTPKSGYTVTGVSANFFTVAGATSATNPANSGVITAVFPATGAAPWACGDTLTDTRDSQTYPTHVYGTACWMAQNLNYGTYTAVASSQSLGQKFCQNYSGVNDPTCPIGGLYQWATAMNGASSCNGTSVEQPACSPPIQGLCPTGWHIPSDYEWIYMTGLLGTNEGGSLKEAGTSHWAEPNTGATNSSGFTALPGGMSFVGSFYNPTFYGFWWTSTQYDSSQAWRRELRYYGAYMDRDYSGDKIDGYSVRCVKD